jgi:hypothetical protein
MRRLLSDSFKRRVRNDARSEGELGALVHLNFAQFSNLLHDRRAVGPKTHPQLTRLGALLGLDESECFREVRA